MFANSMSINETVKKLLNVYKITVKLTALSCYFSLFKTPVLCYSVELGKSRVNRHWPSPVGAGLQFLDDAELQQFAYLRADG